MANRVIPSAYFEKRYKKFVKKFPSLNNELEELENLLLANPKTGNDLGSGLFKIRLANKSKGTGKSGGFRVISYLVNKTETGTDIFLITIYDKSEESSIDKNVLKKLVKELFG